MSDLGNTLTQVLCWSRFSIIRIQCVSEYPGRQKYRDGTAEICTVFLCQHIPFSLLLFFVFLVSLSSPCVPFPTLFLLHSSLFSNVVSPSPLLLLLPSFLLRHPIFCFLASSSLLHSLHFSHLKSPCTLLLLCFPIHHLRSFLSSFNPPLVSIIQ